MYFVENKFVALDVLRTTNLCKEYSQVRKIWVFLGVAPCKRIREPWNFCLWNPEYEKLLLVESRIWLKESGIPLTIEIQSPSSTDKDWNTVPGIWNPLRGIRNPKLSWIPLHGASCDVGIVQCLFNLLYYVIRWSQPSARPTNYRISHVSCTFWRKVRGVKLSCSFILMHKPLEKRLVEGVAIQRSPKIN